MYTYIALLRGINVSGHKKIIMAELRSLLTTKGFVDVKTYIQSGNIVFKTKQKDVELITNTIFIAIEEYFGFQVPVLIKTREQLNAIFNACPFKQEKQLQSYFTLLYKTPSNEAIKTLEATHFENEEITMTSNCIYSFYKNGYGKAKFNNTYIANKLKVLATTRNYKTMVKLLDLSLI